MSTADRDDRVSYLLPYSLSEVYLRVFTLCDQGKGSVLGSVVRIFPAAALSS